MEYEELDRLGVDHRLDGTEAQILGNLHTLVDGLARAVAGSPLTVEEVCELNRVLLTGTRLAERGGVIRAEQNWIGGNRVNPVGAAYVPPSPDAVPALMEDLVAFANHSELPPIATAAIAHAQLETIHPFADGNGRAGRALVHLILKKGGTTRVTVPPISLLLATDRERYIANLAAFRFEGDDETKRREAVNGWVEYFARTTCEACSRASAFEETLLAIREGWRAKVPFREGSAGAQLRHPLRNAGHQHQDRPRSHREELPSGPHGCGRARRGWNSEAECEEPQERYIRGRGRRGGLQCLRALAGHHLG